MSNEQRAMSDENGGRIANRNGRSAEDMIADWLLRKGVRFVRQKHVGSTIYRTRLKTDVYIEPYQRFPAGLAIESKWQDSTGSADEKFPYLVANIRAGAFPCPVVVVVAGGAARIGAFQWLRAQQDDRLIHVFTTEEFMAWTNRSL